MIRTPEPYWRNIGPKTPWGPFDPDAVLNFSFDLAPWIISAGPALSLSGCEVLSDPRLVVLSDLVGAVVTVRLRAGNPLSIATGDTLAFTLRMVLSDGQRDDRTFYLLVRDR